MAYVPGEVVRRAINPTLTPARAPFRQPATTALRPGYNSPSPGPLRTDASSGGYSPYTLPPDPNYLANVVGSDPTVMAANLALQTGTAQGNTGVTGLASKLGIEYGDSSIFGPNQALLPGTADAAALNTAQGHSTLALLNLANAHATDAMYSHLAATGLLHSGETGFEQGLEAQRDSLARYNALTPLQDQLQTAISGNINTQQNLRDAVTNAINAAKPIGNLPGPTQHTVGVVPPYPANPPGGPYHGATYGPGTYQNVRGGSAPVYKSAPGAAAPHLSSIPSHVSGSGGVMIGPGYRPLQHLPQQAGPQTPPPMSSVQNYAGLH